MSIGNASHADLSADLVEFAFEHREMGKAIAEIQLIAVAKKPPLSPSLPVTPSR
jgi:hypothetical protein